jgi:ubiquinone biosynthesis protein
MSRSATQRRRTGLHIGRYTEIISVLVRFGFGDILSNLNIEKYILLTRKVLPARVRREPVSRMSRWERVRLALEELGPTFIKLGQFMSNRPDVLPAELITELEKLQDAVPPFPADQAREIVEQQLEQSLEQAFAAFDDTPLASGSVAQVHRATLRGGERVAVKVRRPNVIHRMRVDIDILYHLSWLAERHYPPLRHLRPTQFVEEFERMVTKELDFMVEASHIERFANSFRGAEGIKVPKVYRDFTTRAVLTTEFVEGVKISDLDRIRKLGLDTVELAKRGADLMLIQIFDHGFFHADPHPGNILVLPDGTLCFLDFGAVGIMPPTLRYNLSLILYGVITKDPQRIIKTLVQLTHRPIVDIASLEYDLTEFIEEYSLAQLRNIDVGEILRRFSSIIMEHELRIIPGFYPLLKAIVTTEGVGYRLYPEFDMVAHVEPYVRRLVLQLPSPERLPGEIYFATRELYGFLRDLPFELKDLMHLVRAGEVRVQFQHRGLEPVTRKLDDIVNKLVFALVLASLIIGSSVIIHSGIPPIAFGIPVIGLVGYAIAGLIGFGLLFSMIRRRI